MACEGIELPVQHTYFFDQGLRFGCLRCGSCCTGAPGIIYVCEHEIASIARYLGQPVDAFVRHYLYPCRDSYSIREDESGNCLFFNGQCLIYTVRPKQCRTWPFWLSNLRSEKAWRQAARQCPGIGGGRLYEREEIIDRIRENMLL